MMHYKIKEENIMFSCTMKRIAILLTIMVLTSVLSSCGLYSDKAGTTTSGTTKAALSEGKANAPELAASYKEFETPRKITITWFEQGWTGPEKELDFVAEEIAKRTNLTLEYVPMTVPTGDDYNQKLNLMIASNDVPDFFFGGSDSYTRSIYEKLGDMDKIWEMTAIIKGYPQLEALVKPEMTLFKTKSGKNYFIPTQTGRGNELLYEAPHGLFVREDFLNKLGMQYPVTIDELYTYLKRSKDEIKVNGESIIPMVLSENLGGLHNFYMPFLPILGAHGVGDLPFDYRENFKVRNYLFTNSPELMAASKFIYKLSSEGLFDNEALVIKQAQVQEKVSSGRAAAAASPWWDMNTFSDNAKSVAPDIFYAVTPPIYSSPEIKTSRQREWTNWIGCWSSLIVNKKIPEDSVKHLLALMDYLTTKEGQLLIQAGVEGVSYEYNSNGRYQFTEDFKKKTNDLDWNKAASYGVFYYSQLVFNMPAFTDIREEAPSLVRADNKKGWENQKEVRDLYRANMAPPKDYYFLAGPVEEEKFPAILDAQHEFWAKIITAKSEQEVEKIVNDWAATCNKLGINEIIAERQKYIDSFKLD